jgi:ABC-2 type transport system ATP-binding protein
MSNQIAVQIRSLTKTIGNKTIVDNLSFDIPKGEVFGFLGPNGAGKTTTIRMIVGLISRTRGEVFVNGIDTAKNFREAMAHIGVIVENPEMYKYLTGYQNLKHFAKMSENVTNQRIDEVVKQVGLENRIHEKVKTYSLGMRQRLGLAQALLRNPSVLILDEPTNGLDPAGIRELRDYLRSLAKVEGIAVVVSSHLLSEMELMCDRVAVIQAGKLISVKTIQEMMQSGENERVTAIEVDDSDLAQAALRKQFPNLGVTQNGKNIEVTASHHEIPNIVGALVHAGIKLYAIGTRTKTLEDTFLEMTGGSSIV